MDKQTDDTDSLADFSEEQLALELSRLDSESVPVTTEEPASGPVTSIDTQTESVVVTVGGPVTTVTSVTDSVTSSLLVTAADSTRGIIPQPPAPVRVSQDDGSIDEYYSCRSESPEQEDNQCYEHQEVTASDETTSVHMMSEDGKSIHYYMKMRIV